MLFIYASVSKLIDYQKFKVQLGQSPLLTEFAGIMAWLIPAIEIVIALMLAIARLRFIAMYAAFCLMVMFTAYIVTITKFSDYVPCSCGGILQRMSWGTHLLFNICVVLVTVAGVIFSNKSLHKNPNEELSTE